MIAELKIFSKCRVTSPGTQHTFEDITRFAQDVRQRNTHSNITWDVEINVTPDGGGFYIISRMSAH